MTLREVEAGHDGPGYCPKCNGPIDYGDSDHSVDSYSYECWCSGANGCGWQGYEVYDLSFSCYMENENEEVHSGPVKRRSKSPAQWDGKDNS